MEQQHLGASHAGASVMEGKIGEYRARRGTGNKGIGPRHSTCGHPPKNYRQPTIKTTGHAQAPTHLTDPPQPHEHKAETWSRTPTKEFTNGTSFTYTCRVIEQQVCIRGLYRCSQFCDSSVIAIVPNISTERLAITGIMATI